MGNMILNSKSEARNPKQIRRFEIQMTQSVVSNFGHLSFGFVSDFDIRISDLG